MAKAKKSKAKKPAKKKAKVGKPAKSRRAPARAAKGKVAKSKKVAARKPAKKAKKSAPKKKQIVGEGDYAASRAFDKDQAAFVKRNKAKIPQMGKEAEKALDGPEGEALRAAEQEAMNRSLID